MEPQWPRNFQPDIVREAFGEKLSSYVLALEAWRRGLAVSVSDSRMYKFRIRDKPGREVRFLQSRPHMTTRAAHLTAKNKHRTNQLLDAAGIPAPKSVVIDPKLVTITELNHLADSIGFPVVIKPRNGAMGDGVYANIQDHRTLEERFAYLKQKSPSTLLVLESHVPGEDYRVLVFEGVYLAAVKRIPANITGDGESTVHQLINQKNLARRKNPFLSKGLIKADPEVSEYLAECGYSYSSIPAYGEYLRLRSAANASSGGDTIDATEELPQSIRESAIRSLDAVPKLSCAGVDVLYEETKTATHAKYVVLELNSQPEIGINMYPSHGSGVDVPKRIIDICFPESERIGDTIEPNLGLRLQPALKPLASGHASEVTFPSIPRSRYKMRRLFDLNVPVALSQRQITKLLRHSKRHSVSGFVRNQHNSPQLMTAGKPENVLQFLESFSTITGAPPSNARDWIGPVYPGFEIDL